MTRVVLSMKTSKMSESLEPPDLMSCSHSSNAAKVCKLIYIICEIILTVTLQFPSSLWDICVNGLEGGICPEKVGKRKRDCKTKEGRERQVHGPAVRVVRGQGMLLRRKALTCFWRRGRVESVDILYDAMPINSRPVEEKSYPRDAMPDAKCYSESQHALIMRKTPRLG
jgi:hypothetical protein